jgi:hypothetical protein
MESYKHSCPVCGQHVEYTAGYCGRQMQCPICGNTITFPAIPPSKTGSKSVFSEKPKRSRQWAGKAGKIFGGVWDFPHWNTVMQVLVPFVIIGVLLAAAVWVKNKYSDEPAPEPAPVIQADSAGWDKMTKLAQADRKMQQYVQSILQTRKALAAAQAADRNEQKRLGEARDPDEKQAISSNLQSYERAVNQTQDRLTTLQRQFQIDYEKYRGMGGTVDYASQVPY